MNDFEMISKKPRVKKPALRTRLHTMNVLIGEDDSDITYVYKKALEKKGHLVTIAGDGNECLTLYEESLQKPENNKNTENFRKSFQYSSTYEVVVLDYKMPIKDGLEVAKKILKWNPNQRIIFASAYVKESLEESIKHLGIVVELIQKPFQVSVLIDMIEDIEIFDSVKGLMSLVKQIKDVNNPSAREISRLLMATAKAHKGKTFQLESK
jgi:CheY-like chemotaxis protein